MEHYAYHRAVVEGAAFSANPPLHFANAARAINDPEFGGLEHQQVFMWPIHYVDLKNLTLEEVEPYGVVETVRADAARFLPEAVSDTSDHDCHASPEDGCPCQS